MTEEIITPSTESFDKDGNPVTYQTIKGSDVVDVPRDKDGNMIMTAKIADPSAPKSYSLQVNMPTEEDLESQRIEKIYHDGLLAAQKANSVTTDQVVNEHLPEGAITARTRHAQPIPLSQAGPDDLVKLPNGFETDTVIAETMGYIRRNTNGIGYQEVEDKE